MLLVVLLSLSSVRCQMSHRSQRHGRGKVKYQKRDRLRIQIRLRKEKPTIIMLSCICGQNAELVFLNIFTVYIGLHILYENLKKYRLKKDFLTPASKQLIANFAPIMYYWQEISLKSVLNFFPNKRRSNNFDLIYVKIGLNTLTQFLYG